MRSPLFSLSWIFLSAVLLCCNTVAAQDTTSVSAAIYQSTHSTLFGIGGVRQLDTYLSPVEYSGPQLLFLKEKLRPTRLIHGRVTYQGILQTDASLTRNRIENVKTLGANIRYDATWHYNWQPLSALRIMAGPQIGGNAGFLYNTRNGNNPAQALVNIDIAASAAAIYIFKICGHTCRLREQLDLPLVGLMFSPNYNQSYYEIFSLGNTDHNIRFTSPFNRPDLRNQLTLDFPLLGATIRAGYLIDVRQSHVNNIRHHSYTHAFVLGWVKHFTYRNHHQSATEGYIM